MTQQGEGNTAARSATLQGKRIVLLGGTSGLGLATAAAAAREGAAVVVVSSKPDRVARALDTLPPGSEGHAADLGDEVAVRRLFDAVGAFDHLVYTAGESLQLGPLADTDLQIARRFFELRYWGALTAVKLAAPRIRPGGSIVLTTGIASLRPRAGWALGASVCGAMDALTRALAVELAPLRVNAVSPGVIRTPLWDSIPEADRAAMYESVAASLPVGRIGEAEDVAQAYLYLMRQPFGTGQALVVDGGTILV